MKRLMFTFIVLAGVILFACSKDDDNGEATPFDLLTAHTWVSDSLLADGEDAGGEGQLLHNFNGDVQFRADGTGNFGEYTGSWSLSDDNQEITINTNELPIPIVAAIVELNELSLKITTAFPDMNNPGVIIDIRMTFRKK